MPQPLFWTLRLTRALDAAQVADFEAIPGVVAWPSKVKAPENAVGLVKAKLATLSIPFSVELPPDAVRETIKDARRAVPLMRAEVAGFGPFPKYLTPYQAREFATILRMPGGSGMAFWAAGSGKTLLAIMWALAGVGRVVVVTKAAVKHQWAGEVHKFTHVTPRVLEGTSVAEPLTEADTFVILSYEILPDWIAEIERWCDGFAVRPSVVYDESQKVASKRRWSAIVDADAELEGVPAEDGNKPKVTFRLAENIAAGAWRLSNKAGRVLTTTATPMRDRRRNLWAQLDLAHPRSWGSYWPWAKRYCDAHEGTFGGMDDTGRSNDAELRDRLAVVVSRVTFAEANACLPAKRRRVVYVTIKEQVRAAMTAEIRAVARSQDPTAIREALLLEASARKRRWLADNVEVDVENGLKVIVFTGRRKDCDDLLEKFSARYAGRALVVGGHGGHSTKEREDARVRYMAAKGPAILVGTTDAWGECVPAEEIIGGGRPIGEVSPGDTVIGESGPTKVTGKNLHSYSGNMITVYAQGMLPVRATTAHPVLIAPARIAGGTPRKFEFTAGPTWRDIERVQAWTPDSKRPTKTQGDFLLIPRVKGRYSSVVFNLADYALNENARRGRATRGDPQEIKLTTDLAWVLGLYAAEGSTTGDAAGHVRSTWSLSAQEHDLADRVIATLAAHGLHAKKRVQKTWMHVTSSSAPFGRLLRQRCGAGAANKRIPAEILFNSDLGILRAFLDGYVAGDGHESEQGRKVYALTVSRELALNLQLALARFGRLAGIIPWIQREGCINGRVVRARPGYVVTWRWTSKRHDRFKVLPDYIAAPVKRVEHNFAFNGPVGSITTEDSTFLAANAVLHNGVNLQDSDKLYVTLLPYTPGAIIQLEGRVARLGQTRPVEVIYGVAEGTIDERISSLLLTKLPSIEKVVDQDEVASFARELSGVDDAEVMTGLVNKILGR